MIRTLKWLAGLALLVYLGALAFLWLEQRRLLYFPQDTKVPAAQTNFSIENQGLTLRGWVLNPGQDRAVLYFGGNGDPVQNMRARLQQWAPQRTIYLLAYRGYGASEGTPTEQGLFADALALYDAVRNRHSGVAVVGRSLGTGVATYLAARRPVERLALITPYDSVERVAQVEYPIVPVGLLLRDKFESWRYAPDVHCPVLMVEAVDDDVIPEEDTERLRAVFSPPPQWLEVEGADHDTILRNAETATALTAFLQTAP